MYDVLVLAEKSSAYKKFVKIMGGVTGTFGGKTYKLTHSHGHLMTLKDPTEQVSDPQLVAKYGSWDNMQAFPWNPRDFKWVKTYIKAQNPRTKRTQSTQSDIAAIKADAADCRGIVIATDDDPSGEGDLLGWEICEAIGWSKPVYRIRFADESASNFTKAWAKMTSMDAPKNWGIEQKAEARSRWDFCSMQLTRIATYAARKAGYNVRVCRLGRLKSVVIARTYQQLQAIANYVKKPYYEVKYQDENGHKFTRAVKKDDTPAFRFANQADGSADLAQYHPSVPAQVTQGKVTTAPGSLLDLGKLGSILSTQGYSSKEVLATYQKMYEAEIVSYPRTADTKITQEQFDALLPLVDKIATVVGVDKKLLTHRTLRKKHMIKVSDHGANRPGPNVPTSLDALKQYGKSAVAIYQTLAKAYLSILGEDAVYEQTKAVVKDHPEFTTSFKTLVDAGYRGIFADDDNGADDGCKLGEKVTPYLDQGVNPKPGQPTQTMILSYLKRHNLGTGATQLSSIAQVTNGKYAEIKETRGKFKLTDIGKIDAVLTEGTWIASANITKQLFSGMDAVAAGKMSPEKLVDSCTNVVKHDQPILLANAGKLQAVIGAPKGSLKAAPMKDKVSGNFNGQIIQFNTEWGGHKFTQAEVAALLAGKIIHFQATSKYGNPYEVKGQLKKQTYKKHSFYGFKPDFK